MRIKVYVFEVQIDAEVHPEAKESPGRFSFTMGAHYRVPDVLAIVNNCLKQALVKVPRYRHLRLPCGGDLVIPENRLDPFCIYVEGGVHTFPIEGPATLTMSLASTYEAESTEFRWNFDPGDLDWSLLDSLHTQNRRRGRRRRTASSS